ncbi:protein/nucleic acid deglycase dj-1 [Anaeramoeba ignava]|uniref:Protein/nucleic acid deglycase dj-1 n=1 Tax=Anaeramoeba ignava TaxID=1746090 RepID=A0A9Q0R509_ANAIG|nr:protein/nucleic acid deglycase dj-1 [Anaeramoeba ignava]
MVKALIILAEGFEEIEAITPIDLLRRAGIEVTIAGIGKKTIKGSRGISFGVDSLLEEVKEEEFDAIILPGGMPGTKNLAANQTVIELVKKYFKAGKCVAAICAAPGFVLADACKIVKGIKCCGYPGTDKLIEQNEGILVQDDVFQDGKVITARGPGFAIPFALKIINELVGKEEMEKVGKAILIMK